MLILELKQDLEDNGILDCLRVIKPPSGVVETIPQKNARLAAQWDSSCSFESSFDWFTQLKTNFGITTLVDSVGLEVEGNIEDQADMCEIIRAAVAAGIFSPYTDVRNIPFDILKDIECPGEDDESKICAVSGSSFYNKDSWTILLEGMSLTIDNKPGFIKKTDKLQRYESPSEPGDTVNKGDLLSLKRIKGGGNLEIDKLIAEAKETSIIDKSRPNEVLKRTSTIFSTFDKEYIKPNEGWKFFKSGYVEVKSPYNMYLITFSMISGDSPNNWRLSTRLLLDELPQITSRTIQGYLKNPCITTAFVSQLQAGSHKIATQYKASAKFSLDVIHKEAENISTGAILMPHKELYLHKIINTQEFQLMNDNVWDDFPSLQTTKTLEKSAYVLIMYNVSLPGMNSHIVTRIDINNVPQVESRSISGDSMYWGIHNGFVTKFSADVEYNVRLKYRTPYPSKANPRDNDWESQSLMLLQLPDWAEMKPHTLTEEFNLNCEDIWTEFPKTLVMVEVESNQMMLFVYNIVLPLVDKKMTIGIFMNDLLDKRSISTYSSAMYFKAVGYWPISLDKGRYRFNLKYKTNACVKFKPQTDWQNISFSVLNLN